MVEQPGSTEGAGGVSSAPPATPRGRWWWLLGVAVLALAMRLGVLAELDHLPLLTSPFGDAREYHQAAVAIAAGEPAAEAGSLNAPRYPDLLAIWIRILGESPRGLVVVQAIAGALTVLFATLIARRVVGPRAGLVAGVLLAVYPPLVFAGCFHLATTWAGLFLFAGLWLLSSRCERIPWTLAGGVALGLACLMRMQLLPTAVLLALWPLAARCRAATVSAFIGLAVVLLALAPGLPTSSGINFYIGNGPGATGTYRTPEPLRPVLPGTMDLAGLEKACIEVASRETGRALDAGEASRYWWGEGLAHVGGHPFQAVGQLGWKGLLTLGAQEIPNHFNFEVFRQESALLGAGLDLGTPVELGLPVDFALLAGLALAALVLRPPRRASELMWWGLLVLLLAPGVIFFAADRFRLAAVVPLTILGCGAFSAWAGAGRSRRLWAVGSGALAAVLLHLPEVGFSHTRNRDLLAEMSIREERFEQAARQIELAKRAGASPTTHYLEGLLAVRSGGDPARAEVAFREAIRLDPKRPDFQADLAWLLVLSDRLDEAERVLSDVVGEVPDYGRAWSMHGYALRRLGRFPEAIRSLERAIAVDPADAISRQQLERARAGERGP